MLTTCTPRKLPNPRAVALLGTMLCLDVESPTGKLVRHEWDWWDGPGVLWSPAVKGFFIFPRIKFAAWKAIQKPGAPMLREQRLDMKETYKILRANGVRLHEKETMDAAKIVTRFMARPATRFTQKTVDSPSLKYQGNGVKLDYRSDKWNGRGGKRVNYTHDLSSTGSDKVSTSGDGTSTRPPYVIFVKGPRLTVNERGIIY
jgi:hypothetical protein